MSHDPLMRFTVSEGNPQSITVDGVDYRLSAHNSSNSLCVYVYDSGHHCIGTGMLDHKFESAEVELENAGIVDIGDYYDWMKLDCDQQVNQLAKDVIRRWSEAMG